MRGKRRPHKTLPDLGKTSTLRHHRLRVWSIDIISMPTGKGGYTGILSMIDCATKWSEGFPIRKSNAATIGKILRNYICPRYGYGSMFTTDRAKEMVAKEVKRAVEECGAKFYETTSYHSQSNPIERFNLTLNQIIRVKLIDQGWRKEAWPDCLPEALLTINLAPDSETKKSAYVRVYGQNPITKATVWFGQVPNNQIDEINREIEPWKPDENEEEQEDEMVIVDDTPESLTIEVSGEDGQKIIKKYDKWRPNDGSDEVHYHQVKSVQELAQEERYLAGAKRHEINQKYMAGKRSEKYNPLVGEIVDFKSKVDPNSMFSRKPKEDWIGPFKMIQCNKPFTALIRPLDKNTKCVYGEVRKVWIGDLRTSTIFNNHHESFIPPWYPFDNQQAQINHCSLVHTPYPVQDMRANVQKEDEDMDAVMIEDVEVEQDNDVIRGVVVETELGGDGFIAAMNRGDHDDFDTSCAEEKQEAISDVNDHDDFEILYLGESAEVDNGITILESPFDSQVTPFPGYTMQ